MWIYNKIRTNDDQVRLMWGHYRLQVGDFASTILTIDALRGKVDWWECIVDRVCRSNLWHRSLLLVSFVVIAQPIVYAVYVVVGVRCGEAPLDLWNVHHCSATAAVGGARPIFRPCPPLSAGWPFRWRWLNSYCGRRSRPACSVTTSTRAYCASRSVSAGCTYLGEQEKVEKPHSAWDNGDQA